MLFSFADLTCYSVLMELSSWRDSRHIHLTVPYRTLLYHTIPYLTLPYLTLIQF